MKLLKNYKKLGHKGFMNKWKEGMMRITPIQLVKSEIKAMVGVIIGTMVAVYIFIFVHNQLWIIAVIMFFNLILQGSQLIAKLQQLNTLKQFDSIQEIKEVLSDDFSEIQNKESVSSMQETGANKHNEKQGL